MIIIVPLYRDFPEKEKHQVYVFKINSNDVLYT